MLPAIHRQFCFGLSVQGSIYYSDLTPLQCFQPMAVQLSKKAVLPLAKILATASCRNNKTGPGAPHIPLPDIQGQVKLQYEQVDFGSIFF